MVVQASNLNALVAAGEVVRVEGHDPFETFERPKAALNNLVGGFHPRPVSYSELNTGDGPRLTPGKTSDFVEPG